MSQRKAEFSFSSARPFKIDLGGRDAAVKEVPWAREPRRLPGLSRIVCAVAVNVRRLYPQDRKRAHHALRWLVGTTVAHSIYDWETFKESDLLDDDAFRQKASCIIYAKRHGYSCIYFSKSYAKRYGYLPKGDVVRWLPPAPEPTDPPSEKPPNDRPRLPNRTQRSELSSSSLLFLLRRAMQRPCYTPAQIAEALAWAATASDDDVWRAIRKARTS